MIFFKTKAYIISLFPHSFTPYIRQTWSVVPPVPHLLLFVLFSLAKKPLWAATGGGRIIDDDVVVFGVDRLLHKGFVEDDPVDDHVVIILLKLGQNTLWSYEEKKMQVDIMTCPN